MPELEQLPINPDLFRESVDGHESVTGWLIADPSLRYRLRDALQTFSIKQEKYDYGYSARPFIDMNSFVERFDLPVDPESNEGRNIALGFLDGCIELRDSLTAFKKDKTSERVELETFSQLPTFLQYLAAFKVIGRPDVGYDLAEPQARAKIKGYFVNHLGVPLLTAEDIMQSSTIVHAPKVIEMLLTYPDEADAKTTGLDISVLAGPASPETGIHFGQDLESATIERVSIALKFLIPKTLAKGKWPSWMDKEDRAEQKSWRKQVFSSIDAALQLTGCPENQYNVWRSYLLTKGIFAHAFHARSAMGFDGGLDQFVGWNEPVADTEYAADSRMKTANEWLEAAQTTGLDERGVALAKQAFVHRIVEQVEAELVYGKNTKRTERLKAAARLMREIRAVDQELVEEVLHNAPLLRSTLLRNMDPYGYKFKHS